jgi:hypothetical protein
LRKQCRTEEVTVEREALIKAIEASWRRNSDLAAVRFAAGPPPLKIERQFSVQRHSDLARPGGDMKNWPTFMLMQLRPRVSQRRCCTDHLHFGM